MGTQASFTLTKTSLFITAVSRALIPSLLLPECGLVAQLVATHENVWVQVSSIRHSTSTHFATGGRSSPVDLLKGSPKRARNSSRSIVDCEPVVRFVSSPYREVHFGFGSCRSKLPNFLTANCVRSMDIQGRWLRQVFTSQRAESFVAKDEPGHIMSVESH